VLLRPASLALAERRAVGDAMDRLSLTRRLVRSRLHADGLTVRVLVPYGEGWYGYFMRRLAERPANPAFRLRSLARR
jgi:proline dehydrogenase